MERVATAAGFPALSLGSIDVVTAGAWVLPYVLANKNLKSLSLFDSVDRADRESRRKMLVAFALLTEGQSPVCSYVDRYASAEHGVLVMREHGIELEPSECHHFRMALAQCEGWSRISPALSSGHRQSSEGRACRCYCPRLTASSRPEGRQTSQTSKSPSGAFPA